MRNNSETFDLHNQAAQRELRLVIEIGFDLPLYITSHNDIPNLPANAVLGALKKCSATSQKLTPEQGLAQIGAISFEVVDLGGQLSYVLRDELEQGNGIRGRTVRLYQGFSGLDWEDFRLEQTQIAEESLSYAEGVYRVRCRDIQREMRRDIFVPNRTRLAANFDKSDTTLQVFDTSAFEPNPHTSAYGDAPNQSVYYLKIKYQDGFEIVRSTGKTGNSFTGCTRGLFGTFARDHTLPDDSDDESGVEVEEFIYLEGPGPQLAYASLTGKILGTNNVLPSNWHLGIDPAFVVLDEFENVGADWYKPSDHSKGKILRFDGLEKTDGKKFIETEINLLLGAFMPVNAAGQLGFRRMAGVLAESGTVATIGPDDVRTLGELDYKLAGVKNAFSVQWSWFEQPGFDGKFLRSNNLIDADSINVHGEAKQHNLKFRGLHNSRHTYTTIKNTFDALRDRFAGPPLTLRLGLLPSKNDLEVGDIVRVSLPQLRDHSIRGDRPLQWNFSTGKEGWYGVNEGSKIETSAAGGVLSVTCKAFDPYFVRNIPADEQFAGVDIPYVKIRLRRTSVEPIPAGSNFFWRDAATSTYRAVNIGDEVDRLNALPVNTWYEITLDLSGNPDWTGNTIEYIRWDIGSNWVADWAFDVDYIRLLPALGLDEYSLDRAMEVQRISVDQVSGAVSVDLFGSYQPAGMIADQGDSTSAELPDAWYDSEGTAMTAAGLSIDASGFLTADGTLSGNSDTRAIYYYPGDLTIPAGRTISVDGNVELRVRGVLQIDGHLKGIPNHNGPGFLGSCYGGPGQLKNAQEIVSRGTARSAWGQNVKGRNEVMPPLNIENKGGDLQGIPDDLSGSGGARGGNSSIYAYSAGYIPAGTGGDGGSGSAGIVVIARGIAFGVSGKIVNSGEDGSPGTLGDMGIKVPGGSGGGGAPGGIVLLVDGTQNPIPVLSNNKIIACYGVSPSSPGHAGHGSVCLGVNTVRLMYVPKSRLPYSDYEDPGVDPDLQEALDAAAEAKSDAVEALEDLANISADGVLHTNEKLQLIREYNQLVNDQAELDTLASNFGTALDAERADFTNALTALTSYLQGLIPAWNSRQENTPISRTIFDSNWKYAYDQKMALLKAIVDANRERAFYATRNVIGYDETTGQFTDNGIMMGSMQSVRRAQLRAQQASASVFIEAFIDSTTKEDWPIVGGNSDDNIYYVKTEDSGARAGGNVLRIGGDGTGTLASNGEAFIEYIERFPFDPNKLYRLKARAIVLDEGDRNRSLFIGIAGFRADGARCNRDGEDSVGSQHYIACAGVEAAGDGWQEYTGYFKGNASNTAEVETLLGRNSIAQPAQLHKDVRYFSPTAVVNYSDKVGRTQFDYIRIDEVEPTGNGLYLKINSGTNLEDNETPGEAMLCGFDANGNPNSELPGWFQWNGKMLVVPNIHLNPGYTGLLYIVVRASTGYWSSIYGAMCVSIERGEYKYHYYSGSSKHVSFTPSDDHVVIGELHLSDSENIESGGIYQNPRPLIGFAQYMSGLNESGKIVDQRSLQQNVGSIASLPTSSSVLLASDDGSTAKISISAHSVQYAGFTVGYNSGSIAGLNFSTTYYIYVDDPNYLGGAVTYYATTLVWKLAAGLGRRAVGTITTPDNGGGSTVPIDPWCVAEGSWLREGLLVDDCEPGDLVDCWETGDADTHQAKVVRVEEEPSVLCVLLTMESGAQVICSRETPVTDRAGRVYWAQDCQGVELGVLHEEQPMTWEVVERVECAGLRTVHKLSVGGKSYAAGLDPQHRVITHNGVYKSD
ncbi:hypothetical protein [Microbulbifer sp. THAF38]|uniref:hypothetical protein n=1 Tax=Microbulbifer sp. THAF38 TaxID=2587856 RepID=UPI0012A9A989|nr:hypothetical protein [Microbulbifer sp. THAF38]QFT53548.1 hypothetical protein FIU95_03045 [Microbulbifer sp. THAF38]